MTTLKSETTLAGFCEKAAALGFSVMITQRDRAPYEVHVQNAEGRESIGFGWTTEEALSFAIEGVTRELDAAPLDDDRSTNSGASASGPRADFWIKDRWAALRELAGDDEYIRGCAVDSLEGIIMHCPDARLRQLCFEDLERLAPDHPRRMKFRRQA